MWWNILVIPTSHVVLEEYWNANKNLIKKEVRVCLEGKIINIVPFISEFKWIYLVLKYLNRIILLKQAQFIVCLTVFVEHNLYAHA
jgi:hypothetical protein